MRDTRRGGMYEGIGGGGGGRGGQDLPVGSATDIEACVYVSKVRKQGD